MTRSLLVLLIALLATVSAGAQRRSRPSSMKHSEAEIQALQKEKKIACKYVRDGAVFDGAVYRTGGGAAIKVYDCVMFLRGGKYALSFDATKFQFKKHAVMSDAERARKGISKYEYDNTFESKKLGQDFEHSGRYVTMEQYHQQWLILYDGDSDDVFAKIKLDSVDEQTLEFNEDGFLMKLTYVK